MANPESDNGDEDEEESNHSSANSDNVDDEMNSLTLTPMTVRLALTWSKLQLRDWLAIILKD